MQLDTDEVLMGPGAFKSCLEKADFGGFAAILYPARWLFQKAGDSLYLERCDRLWRIQADYPGPVAVRAGTRLRLARQCDVKTFRADFDAHSKTPVPTRDPAVHSVVKSGQGIAHFSWVRSEEEMRRKTTGWGHSKDRDWNPRLQQWISARRHPWRTVMATPFVTSESRFRLARVALSAAQAPRGGGTCDLRRITPPQC